MKQQHIDGQDQVRVPRRLQRPTSASMSATLVELVRTHELVTTGDLCEATGMGRTVVAQRIAQLLDSGLLAHRGKGRSTGGRAPRELRFHQEAATVLGVEVGVTSLMVGLTDLGGTPLEVREADWDVTCGPEGTLARVEQMVEEILAAQPTRAPLAGVGVGLPCPVEFASGRPVSPPILSGWDDYPVRERLAAKFGVEVWVDNEVNAMALGELRSGTARGVDDFVYVKVGTGIGAGLVSAGRLHRGAQGCAGDIAHLCMDPASTRQCRCGKQGCLQTFASGSALGRAATELAESGQSLMLARRLAEAGAVTAEDLSQAAAHGDPLCVELMTTAGQHLGEALTSLINVFNPELVVIGGGVSLAGDLLLPSLRKTVYARSLPLATRDLRVTLSAHADQAGVVGAALTAVDELLSAAHLDTLTDLLTTETP
ncbi:ROK family transcriptional regulator [Actinomadura opuntiae]|uniref:ROK family transcriptional regulator n=1 Tax=Actinomadura sp. OS1-43 TaxID=604315 RepID=UPI00255B113C|nr:ROK family protein [Actinomadura sp. OS1-43]MDL4821095.1 ROK family protein [Actinomadura sp. OS1-43]